jgi:hypothetical protein
MRPAGAVDQALNALDRMCDDAVADQRAMALAALGNLIRRRGDFLGAADAYREQIATLEREPVRSTKRIRQNAFAIVDQSVSHCQV